MKRGKDDEKIMEPMFPKLHVNDTEKGGPRGPPRNKMALYEQFSIPSQRSICQGSDHQKSAMFPLLHLNRTTHPAEDSCAGYSNYNPPSPKFEKRMKLGEEDFTVPILVQSEIGQGHSKNSSGMNRGKLFSSGPTYSGHSMEVQNSSDREPKRARSQLRNSLFENDVSNEHARGIGSGLGFRRDYCSEELGSPNSSTSNSVCHEDETCGSLNIGNEDRGDDASEISMVDSIPGLDICPDDVVAVIGQKHFLKARRAIVNQQRMFAVQVFELHKLIKVQRSFAGSPHLLVEDSAYLGNPLKGSSAKKLPLELVVKPYPRDVKHNDDSSKPSHNMECSAENTVGKTSLSSVQNDSNVLNNKPLSTPYVSDAKTSPWGFHQPPGQQWLIPVMSPSEGLIYKPYNPGHGFMGSLCGGCGFPPGSNPMLANFVNPAYGVASSHHPYQGIGGPPYGMQFVNGAISNVVKPRATKERSELQGISMESSPGKGARGIRGGPTSGGRNALPLLPTSQAVHVPDVAHQLHDTDQVTRVIKVVPHKAMSATASVARIFQSIQEGRKQ